MLTHKTALIRHKEVFNLYNSNEDMVASVVYEKKKGAPATIIIGTIFAALAAWLFFSISTWWAIALGVLSGLLSLVLISVFFSDKSQLKKFLKYTLFYDRANIFLDHIVNMTNTPSGAIMTELKLLKDAKLIKDYAVYEKTGQIIISSAKTGKYANLFDAYMPFYNKGKVELSEIKSKKYISSEKIIEDLKELADFGAIEKPIIDEDAGTVEIKTIEFQEMSLEEKPVNKKPAKAVSPEVVALLQDGAEAVTELARLRDSISDEDVKDKVDEVIVVTSSIFKKLSSEPEIYNQAKRFSNYYLPKTMKLITTYDDLQNSSVQSEKVSNMLEQISTTLDTLIVGLKGLYDSLYESKVYDIESDIAVLESMLKRDGIYETSTF